jgi:integrase/recombinase XerD
VYQVLHRLDQATGIHTHPHKFRHTFATRALAAGVDSLVLQRALGHTSLAMVNVYVHHDASSMLDAWRRRPD